MKDLEDKLETKLGSRVQIKYINGKGHIKIDYFSLDEFEKIYNVLFTSWFKIIKTVKFFFNLHFYLFLYNNGLNLIILIV